MPPAADVDVIQTIRGVRAAVAAARAAGKSIGFVPTMGALHAGHAALLDRARGDCGYVVVSIFINPTQFDRADDLNRYPRTLDSDVALCREHGADVVFAPSVEEMYPREPVCTVDPGPVASHCCGRFRPGHFRGVATVVLKLLEIVRPDVACFGEKDAQQLTVVRRLVSDFDLPVTIAGVATVRESDGLALSSRNQNLSVGERRLAPVLYRALRGGAELVEAGVVSADEITARVAAEIGGVREATLEYVNVVDPETFQPVDTLDGRVIIAAAMWLGHTRLIDNVICVPSGR